MARLQSLITAAKSVVREIAILIEEGDDIQKIQKLALSAYTILDDVEQQLKKALLAEPYSIHTGGRSGGNTEVPNRPNPRRG